MPAYDFPVAYDTPLLAYDGDLLVAVALRIKDALSRELKFNVLVGLVDPDNIRLDMQLHASSDKSDYPFVLFRRITSSEDNRIRYARERIEIEVVGRHLDPNAGDDQVEAICDAILRAFAGKHRTWGKFNADGTPNNAIGLRMRCRHINTIPDNDDEEVAQLIILMFTYIRS